MGIDDGTPTRHTNIQSIKHGEIEHLGVVKLTDPGLSNVYFSGSDAQIMLTLTHDGRMVLGPGISKQKATQEIAQMLVKEYHKLTGVDII